MNWKHLKLEKHLNKTNLTILFLVGILLVVIAIPTGTDKKKSTSKTSVSESISQEMSYKQEMEQELEHILSRVKGVGNAEVLISLKTSEKQIVEKDNQSDETRMEESTVYAENSEGGQTPYVRQITYPEIEGVLIIADGGDNAIVEEEMKEAVQALFDVDTHKIKIMKRNS